MTRAWVFLGGRVTGYQLQCCGSGIVGAARFCLRSFPPFSNSSEKLRDWAFISYTGMDPDIGSQAEAIHDQLLQAQIDSFSLTCKRT